MKKLIIMLAAATAFAGQATAQFSIRRNAANAYAVDILYTAPAQGQGLHPAQFFEFALQVPNMGTNQNGPLLTATFAPGAPLAAIAAFQYTKGVDFTSSTFTWQATGVPNYAATYNFPATEVVLGTVTFSPSASALGAVVNAIDYQNQAPYGGAGTQYAVWTFQVNSNGTDMTQYNNLFYQSVAAGTVAGSAAPTTDNNGLVTNQKVSLTNTPLPVELTAFSAAKASDGVRAQLDWTTRSEAGSDYFEVERSATGSVSSYASIGVRVQGQGSSGVEHTYQSYDRSPLSGVNWYRLKVVGLDGKVGYSEARQVRFGGSNDGGGVVRFGPNPLRGVEVSSARLLVETEVAQVVDYVISDGGGRLVSGGSVAVSKGGGSYGIEGLEGLAAGTYYLSLKGATIKANIKISKTD